MNLQHGFEVAFNVDSEPPLCESRFVYANSAGLFFGFFVRRRNSCHSKAQAVLCVGLLPTVPVLALHQFIELVKRSFSWAHLSSSVATLLRVRGRHCPMGLINPIGSSLEL